MSGYDTATDDGLLAAFWDYERALRTNDVPALEHWFLAGPDTLRSDGGTTLVGAGHIARFRRLRPPPGPRRVDRVHLRPLGGGSVAVVAESTRPDGTCAVQSQIWVLGPAGWRIAVAHVSAAAPVVPTITEPARVWRVAGPLRVDPGPAAEAGPLSGVRLAVKDLFALAGHAIGGGSARWLAEAPVQTTTAPSVAALLAAGATVAGIAHTDELAFSLAGVTQSYGAVPNPAAPGCLSGGSTSGPAAAVAGFAADLGVGTDTAGSIRVPASYCGLFGLRPTHGVIDTAGVLPLAPSFDTVGLLSRDPRLLATAADLLLPPADGNNRSEAPVRLLLRAGDLLDGADPGVAPAFESATVALAGRTGCEVEAAPGLAEAVDAWLPAFRTVQAAEAWAAHGEFVTKARSELQPEVVARFEAGRELTEDAVARARGVLAGARDRLAGLLTPGRALLLPATSGPALPLDLAAGEVDSARIATLRLTCLASLAGLPAVAVPTMRLGARPMGLSLIGAAGTDRSLLELINRPAPWDRP
ncbi:MAG: amidase [Pseudonocardiales bacterium]|nr:amidase [Pseudonocardiales bacterium]